MNSVERLKRLRHEPGAFFEPLDDMVRLEKTDHNGNKVKVYVDIITATRVALLQENAIPTGHQMDISGNILEFNAAVKPDAYKKSNLGAFIYLIKKINIYNTPNEFFERLMSEQQYTRQIAVRRAPLLEGVSEHDPWKIYATVKQQQEIHGYLSYRGSED